MKKLFTATGKRMSGAEVRHCSFANMTEMMDYAGQKTNVPEKSRSTYDKQINHALDTWSNGYSFKRIQSELITPPPASAKVKDISDGLIEEYEVECNVRRMAYRREDGDELDPVSWVNRDLDGWSRTEKTAKARKVVRIACNVWANASRSPQQLWYRGAAAAALADAIEGAGHSVEIVGFLCAKNMDLKSSKDSRPRCGSVDVLEWQAKAPDAPLDLDTLVLSLAEIGFMRLGVFTICCAVSEHVSSYLGTEQKILPKEFREDFDIVLDADLLTREQALAAVKKHAKGFETKERT